MDEERAQLVTCTRIRGIKPQTRTEDEAGISETGTQVS